MGVDEDRVSCNAVDFGLSDLMGLCSKWKSSEGDNDGGRHV